MQEQLSAGAGQKGLRECRRYGCNQHEASTMIHTLGKVN